MLKWIDSLDIAIALDEKYPDTDPQYVKCPKTFVNGAFENYISVKVEDNELGRTWKAF